ncbi:MAG TPA: hypothetical protein VGO90_08370 [Chthoniobacteraceae bacterium]|nr:hypothetical protein [Chthoniobacteraceae bacterium]
MAVESRTPNGILIFLGSLAALVIVGALFIWSIAVGPKPQDLDAKRAQQRSATKQRIEQEAHDLLTTTGWVDKEKGVARVPVADVFASTVAELKNKKPQVSQVKVEAPLPMPVIDPNATEPPPLALPSAPQGADTMQFRAFEAAPAPSPAAPAVPGTPTDAVLPTATPAAATPAAAAAHQNPQPVPAPTPAAPTPATPPQAPAPSPEPPVQTPGPSAPAPVPPAPTNPAPAPVNPAPTPANPAPAPANPAPASEPAPPAAANASAAVSSRPALINWPESSPTTK